MVSSGHPYGENGVQSPMHPVPLTEIAIPGYKSGEPSSYGQAEGSDDIYGLSPGLRRPKTDYEGTGGERVHFEDGVSSQPASRGSGGPPPPPHSSRRQFSFFKKSPALPPEEPLSSRPSTSRIGRGSRSGSHTSAAAKAATEEERLGLVKGDTSNSLPQYDEDDTDEDWMGEKRATSPPSSSHESPSRPSAGRVVAGSGSPQRRKASEDEEAEAEAESEHYEQQREKWNEPRGPPPPFDDGNEGGTSGTAFI
jgi:hypothetical protein